MKEKTLESQSQEMLEKYRKDLARHVAPDTLKAVEYLMIFAWHDGRKAELDRMRDKYDMDP